jgi:hypothetical protein
MISSGLSGRIDPGLGAMNGPFPNIAPYSPKTGNLGFQPKFLE